MFIIIWEYQVKTEKRSEFEETYSPNGAWAELFKKGRGYLGTELLRDKDHPQRYLTVDRWASEENYDAFQSAWKKEYKLLDAQCEGLTESEAQFGKWISAFMEVK